MPLKKSMFIKRNHKICQGVFIKCNWKNIKTSTRSALIAGNHYRSYGFRSLRAFWAGDTFTFARSVKKSWASPTVRASGWDEVYFFEVYNL